MKRILTTIFMVCLMSMTVTCGATGCSAQKEKVTNTYDQACVENVEIVTQNA